MSGGYLGIKLTFHSPTSLTVRPPLPPCTLTINTCDMAWTCLKDLRIGLKLVLIDLRLAQKDLKTALKSSSLIWRMSSVTFLYHITQK